MKSKFKLTALSLLLGLAALSGPAHGGDEIAIVANKDLGVSSLSQSDLRPLFQTTKTSWSGGKALPLNLPTGDSTRRGFDAAVLGLDPDRVARYWVDRKIRGGNPPPKALPKASLVLKVVSAKKGAIGYVPASAVNSSVKVVARIRGGRVVSP